MSSPKGRYPLTTGKKKMMLTHRAYRLRSALVLNVFLLGIMLISLPFVPAQTAETRKPIDLSTAIIQGAKQNIQAVVR